MKKENIKFNKLKLLGVLGISCLGYLAFISPHESVEAMKSVATHIGTFEGSTTFTTSSSNGINPGLFIEVMDEDGNLTQYESEEGVIAIPDTKEGAYVTQAKLLGKTKYVDEDTGEILDQFEEGRNLRLESVQMPGLKTLGNSFFSVKSDDLIFGRMGADGSSLINNKYGVILKEDLYFDAIPNKYCWFFPSSDQGSNAGLYFYDENYNFIKSVNQYTLTPENARYMKFSYGTEYIATQDDIDLLLNEAKIGYFDSWYPNPTYSDIEPYKSNVLSTSEDVELRGIGDVQDELDLLTGEMTKRYGVAIMDGSDDENYFDNYNEISFVIYGEVSNQIFSNMKKNSYNILCDKYYVAKDVDDGWRIHNDSTATGIYWFNNNLWIRIPLENLGGSHTKQAFKTWLQSNPITVQYELATPIVKTVALNSNYFFKPINKDSIQVTGTVTPLVGSVTVPTNPVSFVLNPNEETGQQFIAPEFSITNETTAPIQLTLNRFEQITNVLNDVLPMTYENWEGLNKKESKNIALALVPKVSDGWVSLIEGPRYVAETSNTDLGVVKAKSSVDFMFSALHGQAFEETLSPSYRLGFVFEFMS